MRLRRVLGYYIIHYQIKVSNPFLVVVIIIRIVWGTRFARRFQLSLLAMGLDDAVVAIGIAIIIIILIIDIIVVIIGVFVVTFFANRRNLLTIARGYIYRGCNRCFYPRLFVG